MKALFPLVSDAVAGLVPLKRLRWVAFSHVEADECGAVEQFLAAAPQAQVAHGVTGCMVSLNDMLSRLPRPLADGEVVELGGKQVRARRVRHVDTAHVPHNWESKLFEEVTGTLLCGDLFTQTGNPPALVSGDWPIHSTGVAAVLVGPRAGVHYPGSTGGLQAWFRTDSDCVEPPSTRGYPPSLERPPAGRPSRASDQHYSG